MDTTLNRLAAMATCTLFAAGAFAQDARGPSPPLVAVADHEGAPIFGVTIPAGYRQWELIAPSHVPSFDELRGILGNALSTKAYREGTLPFPDGAVLAKLAWTYIASAEFDGAFVTGPVTSIQFMVKDSKRYASTGGWGFGKFTDGKPADEAEHKRCFACHEANVKGHDFVFTRYAP